MVVGIMKLLTLRDHKERPCPCCPSSLIEPIWGQIAALLPARLPLDIVAAGTNHHDSPLLAPTPQQTRRQIAELPAGGLPTSTQVYLDSGKTRDLLEPAAAA